LDQAQGTSLVLFRQSPQAEIESMHWRNMRHRKTWYLILS